MNLPFKIVANKKLTHIDIAMAELGVHEKPGADHNLRILEYWDAHTDFVAETDEIAWCCAFVNYCLGEVGVETPRRPDARSYLKWGIKRPHNKVKVGDIAVWKYGSWQGHVAIVTAVDHARGTVEYIGGNQDNAVSIETTQIHKVAEFRTCKKWYHSTTIATTSAVVTITTLSQSLDLLGIDAETFKLVMSLFSADTKALVEDVVIWLGGGYIIYRKLQKLKEDKA